MAFTDRVEFTKEMKKEGYTILAPNMAPIHFRLFENLFASYGYNVEILQTRGRQIVDEGLKYVHNDTCYPALLTIGQMMDALHSGKYDLHKTALIITQTGGGCRASNYIHLLRKALEKDGLSYIPVISLNMSGLEKNSGFKLTLPMIRKALGVLAYGDLLMLLHNQTRPYEKEAGASRKLVDDWTKKLTDMFAKEKGYSAKEMEMILPQIAEDFANVPVTGEKKVRVGVVGEILVKYMPLANNHVVDLLEREGAEAVVPDLLDFFAATIYEQDFKHTHLGKGWTASASAKLGIPALQRMRRPAIEALKASKRFTPPMAIGHVAELAKPFLSIGNQYGEGWFLAGEMAELITSGTPNIVCIQPFACLPNHVVGKGVIKALRAAYPGANIVAVDYDPGASEVNQLNRIKLMLTAAQRALHTQQPSAPKEPQQHPSSPSISLPHPKVAML